MIEEKIINKLNKLWNKVNDLETRGHAHSIINLGTPTELTIASGVITRTNSYHTVDTQADGSTDDLDTILGGIEGDILVLRAVNSARTVVCKDGTGNLQLTGNISLDHVNNIIVLLFDGTNWLEIASSNNTASET